MSQLWTSSLCLLVSSSFAQYCQLTCCFLQTTTLHFHTLYVSLFLLAGLIVGSSIQDIMGADDGDPTTGMHAKEYRDYKKVFVLLLVWLGPIWSLLLLPKRKVDDPLSFSKDEKLTNETNQEKEGLMTSYQKSLPAPAVVADEEDDAPVREGA